MPNSKSKLLHRLPAWAWLSDYTPVKFKSDVLAALIVVAMLVPQGMAYAMLAGLPPIMGLYASILPMIIYALLGGSSTLSIGPVAIISMMTFATLTGLYRSCDLISTHGRYYFPALGIIPFRFLNSADQSSGHSELYYCLGIINCFWTIEVLGRPTLKSQ